MRHVLSGGLVPLASFFLLGGCDWWPPVGGAVFPKRRDALAQRGDAACQPVAMCTLPAQLLLKLADARRQAGILGRGAGGIAWRRRHHATCRDASVGLVSRDVLLSATAN